MKLSISVKLFLGFLVVIFLNIFFVVVVSKLSDLNLIVNTVKRLNDAKNAMLSMTSMHDAQKLQFLIYESVPNQGRIDNFRENSKGINRLLDTIISSLDAISKADTVTSITGGTDSTKQMLADLIATVNNKIKHHHSTYVGAFESFIRIDPKQSATDALKAGVIKSVIKESSDSLVIELKHAQKLIDRETSIRIKDVDSRINNVKQLTIIILSGMSIFAILFAFLFSRAITNSLRRLREAARLIAKGNFEFNPSGYPRDEIGDLARGLFDMAYDLKEAQEQLVKNKRLAAIGEVVASVNHEINNPLMIISGNAQFLEMSMEGLPADLRDRVHAIIEETDRISRVTRKLREIKNPVVEDYTSSGEQMINLDKSTK